MLALQEIRQLLIDEVMARKTLQPSDYFTRNWALTPDALQQAAAAAEQAPVGRGAVYCLGELVPQQGRPLPLLQLQGVEVEHGAVPFLGAQLQPLQPLALGGLQPGQQLRILMTAATGRAAAPSRLGSGGRRHGARTGSPAPLGVIAAAGLGITQLLPGGIEGQDPLVIAAGIGVMALHQGPVGRLDLRG